jgi:L-rhamnose mutarotase
MRVTLRTRLKLEFIEDYEKVHARIPDDLANALASAGVRDWAIYRVGQDLFHVLDVDNYAEMRRLMRCNPINLEWQAIVAPMHEVADSYEGADDTLKPLWELSNQCQPSPNSHE